MFDTVIYVLFIYLSSCHAFANQVERNVTIFPTTNAVYDGRMAVFNCSTYRFDSLQWAMDDDLVAVVLGMNSEVTITKDGVWLHSSLVVPAAQLVHNDSKITCIGNQLFSETSQNQRKDSQFYVQGLPGEVLNFQGTNVTSSTLKFSWSPPHHVSGIRTCCDKYSVNITNIDSGLVHLDDIINETSVLVDISAEHLCSLYSIEISAYNDLGEGDLMKTTWSLGGFFEANKATELLFYEKLDLILGVNVTIDGYCLNDLDNLTLSVNCESVSSMLSNTSSISANAMATTLQEYITIMIPSTHHDRTCYFNVALENKVDLQEQQISTLDVQNVTVNVIPGSICVSCILVHNSPARGCVLIASQVGVDSNIESKINIPSNESGECLELSPGRYRARVVDWEADGGLSGMYAHQEVVDIIAATSEPVPSSSIATPSQSQDVSVGSGAIAGISIGAVFVVIVIPLVAIAVIIGFIVLCTKQRPPSQTADNEYNLTQFDCTQASTVDLTRGVQVSSYDRIKDILESSHSIKKWDYDHVKCAAGKQDKIKYILITTNSSSDDDFFLDL